MDEQERVDRVETEAIALYEAMRAAWGSAWGRRPPVRVRRSR
jgi:hypothetical protein